MFLSLTTHGCYCHPRRSGWAEMLNLQIAGWQTASQAVLRATHQASELQRCSPASHESSSIGEQKLKPRAAGCHKGLEWASYAGTKA
jgi:hypothetical protein